MSSIHILRYRKEFRCISIHLTIKIILGDQLQDNEKFIIPGEEDAIEHLLI